MSLVERLIGLEDGFRTAADLARELQGRVGVERKSDTGDLATDVVTEADRRVQAAILELLVQTELVGCVLLAEEDGPEALTSRFAESADHYLSIDPIDGTRRYTEGEPYYSLIVGLHDGRRPLYTFLYYPSLEWWIRLSPDGVLASGPPPGPAPGRDLSKVVVYTAGDPERDDPTMVERVRGQGLEFCKGESLGPSGSKFLVLSGQAGGYYAYQPNLFDGLFGLHYGMASGRRVETVGLDLSRRCQSPRGLHYPGYYLILP